MFASLTSYTLFEWMDGRDYCSQFVNRLAPDYSWFERRPHVRRTAVNFRFTEGLDGYWVDTKGQRIFLPWRDLD